MRRGPTPPPCREEAVLTVDGRGDQDVQEFGAVAGVDQLVRTQRVEAQGAAAGLVLRLHHHHHVEAVAGKILPLGATATGEDEQKNNNYFSQNNAVLVGFYVGKKKPSNFPML